MLLFLKTFSTSLRLVSYSFCRFLKCVSFATSSSGERLRRDAVLLGFDAPFDEDAVAAVGVLADVEGVMFEDASGLAVAAAEDALMFFAFIFVFGGGLNWV